MFEHCGFFHSSNTLVLSESGIPLLIKGKESALSPNYVSTRYVIYRHLLESKNPSPLWNNTRHHLETLLVNDADLLVKRGEGALALELYSTICNADSEFLCSPDAQHNIELLKSHY